MVFPTEKSEDTRDPKEERIKEDAESWNLQGKSHSVRPGSVETLVNKLMTVTERSYSENKNKNKNLQRMINCF